MSSPGYHLLPTKESPGDVYDDGETSANESFTIIHTKSDGFSNRIAAFSVALCVISVVVSIILHLLMKQAPSPYLNMYEFQPQLNKGLTSLRRPTQFRNLDKIERPYPAVKGEIINLPITIGHVYSSDSDLNVTSADVCTKRLHNGKEKKHIKVDAKVCLRTFSFGRLVTHVRSDFNNRTISDDRLGNGKMLSSYPFTIKAEVFRANIHFEEDRCTYPKGFRPSFL